VCAVAHCANRALHGLCGGFWEREESEGLQCCDEGWHVEGVWSAHALAAGESHELGLLQVVAVHGKQHGRRSEPRDEKLGDRRLAGTGRTGDAENHTGMCRERRANLGKAANDRFR